MKPLVGGVLIGTGLVRRLGYLMAKDFSSTQEALDYVHQQLIDIRADALATKAAAGIALGLLVRNSPDKKKAMVDLRGFLTNSINDTQVLDGDPVSDKILMEKARAHLEEICVGLERGI